MTEQIVALGRRTSRQRIAYFLCDLLERLQAVGLAEDDCFRAPLTQTDMADALGLGTVHVNRTLQALREDGLIEMRGRTFRVSRRAELKRAASYEREADAAPSCATLNPRSESVHADLCQPQHLWLRHGRINQGAAGQAAFLLCFSL